MSKLLTDHQMIEIFLEYVANIHTADLSGWCALHAAIFKEDVETVRMLLARGADQNMQTNLGNNALHMAAKVRPEVFLYD